jgi:hypothetical protein
MAQEYFMTMSAARAQRIGAFDECGDFFGREQGSSGGRA